MARKRIAWAELRVGVLVLASFTILTLAIILISGKAGFFTPTYNLRTYLASASGLRKGSLVWVAGIEVGNVRDVNISLSSDPSRAVEVTMRINQAFQHAIREDSKASLGSIGLLGDKYIDISRGSDALPTIPPNGEIKGSSEADIRKVIQNSNDLVANFGSLVDKVDSITTKIDQGQGTVGKFINDPSLYNKLNATIEQAGEIVSKVRSGEGAIGKLVNDPELYDHVNRTLARVDDITTKIDSGQGTLGKLIKDPSVYNQTNALLGKINTVAERLEKGEGFLGKMSKDEQLYVQLRDAINKIDALADRINRGEGTMGKLMADPSLYNNLNAASSELIKLLYDFRQDPKKFLRIKVGLF
jgi:phospholipid/cholesterol/gamma-HCH transport system substrate-binding protein